MEKLQRRIISSRNSKTGTEIKVNRGNLRYIAFRSNVMLTDCDTCERDASTIGLVILNKRHKRKSKQTIYRRHHILFDKDL